MKNPKFRVTVILISISLLCYSQDLIGWYNFSLFELNPSPVSLGIGGAGVALTEYDPYCMISNPALTGVGVQYSNLNFGAYLQKNELYQMDYTDNYYCLGGYTGFRIKNMENPLTIAIGFVSQEIKLKNFIRTVTEPVYREELMTYVGINASICYDFGIKLSLGFNYKHSNSESYIAGRDYKATAFDIGMMGLIPVLKNVDIAEDMKLDLNVGIGTNLKNLGSKIGDMKGPRSSIQGYSVNSSIKWRISDRIFEAIKLEWTTEADDQLNGQDSLGSYGNIYSDLQPINNFILLEGSKFVTVRYGFAVSLMDVFQLYFGAQTHCKDGDVEETQGWSIHLKGLLKALDSSIKSSFWSALASHFDIYYYNYSHISSFYSRGRHCFSYQPYDRNYSAISLKIFGY